jgi:agmatinase
MPKVGDEPPISIHSAAGFNYCGLEAMEWKDCKICVLPVPYDSTTSFGTGARWGPERIISTSRNLELYDDEIGVETADAGIYTLPELMPAMDLPKTMVDRVHKAVAAIIETGRFPVVLGGEHSVSSGAIKAALEHHLASGGKKEEFTVIHFDAHSDLREEYLNTPFSHACIMRRVVEMGVPTLQIGIRSTTKDIQEFVKSKKLPMYFSRDRHDAKKWDLEGPNGMMSHVGKKCYITFDVDCFDSSIMPATGTPEPGGLDWDTVMRVLRAINRKSEVVGFDVTELAPIGGMHAPDFLTAKLVYKMLGYRFAKELGGSIPVN